MSNVAQMAREEAERVEAEERAALEKAAAEGADAPADGSDAPPAEPAAESTETPPGEESERVDPASSGPTDDDLKALETEHKRHEKAMRKIMGDDFDSFQPCESCGAVGFVPLGFTPPPTPQPDPNTQGCPACLGLGLVITGSFLPGQETKSCDHCVGKGWIAKLQPAVVAAVDTNGAVVAPAPVPVAGEPVAPPGYILVKTS